jgi:hypothetical protein
VQIGGIENVEQRFTIVHPENCDRFPAHFSMATTVLCVRPDPVRWCGTYCAGQGIVGGGFTAPSGISL